MSARARYRLKRRFVNEAFPLVAVTLVILAVAAVFPREVFTFRPAPDAASERPAACVFVRLSPKQEARVLADARTAWQVGGKGVRRMRAELLTAELPESVPVPVARPGDRTKVARPGPLAYAPELVPSAMAAGEPAVIAPGERAAPAPAFSREELLKIN